MGIRQPIGIRREGKPNDGNLTVDLPHPLG
jgi:hypothetical protein